MDGWALERCLLNCRIFHTGGVCVAVLVCPGLLNWCLLPMGGRRLVTCCLPSGFQWSAGTHRRARRLVVVAGGAHHDVAGMCLSVCAGGARRVGRRNAGWHLLLWILSGGVGRAGAAQPASRRRPAAAHHRGTVPPPGPASCAHILARGLVIAAIAAAVAGLLPSLEARSCCQGPGGCAVAVAVSHDWRSLCMCECVLEGVPVCVCVASEPAIWAQVCVILSRELCWGLLSGRTPTGLGTLLLEVCCSGAV